MGEAALRRDLASLDLEAVRDLLVEGEVAREEELYARADAVRRQHVGDAVHLRAIIEISNVCERACAYCGIAAGRRGLRRYRMTTREIAATARQAERLGYRTLVLQAGEDPALDEATVSAIITAVRQETDAALVLSLGEHSDESLRRWRAAGAERYLLRFESSNEALLTRFRPDAAMVGRDRVAMLRALRGLGYVVGSGCLVGLPGQRPEDRVQDLALMAELDLDMAAIGPFIPHPARATATAEAVAPTTLAALTRRMVALARLVLPAANIPVTTALAVALDGTPRERLLDAGANVIMLDLTPEPYRSLYDLYPGKAAADGDPAEVRRALEDRLAAAGRPVAEREVVRGAAPTTPTEEARAGGVS